MDEFEKEYFDKLKLLASGFQARRQDLAKSRIKMFTATICRQLLEKKEKFDLLLGGGNSGLFMIEIAKLVYQNLKIDLPLTVCLPIYRFINDDDKLINDNSVLKNVIPKKLKDIPKNLNILFIDDEIMRGVTMKAVLDLVLAEKSDIDFLRAVIIAENHFFEWHYNMPKVSVNFFPYARLIQGLNGNIGRFIPDNLFKEMAFQISEIRSYNHAMAIIFGGAFKRKDERGIPYFDQDIETVLRKNIIDYDYQKFSMKEMLKNLVLEGIERYKHNKIYFRF